MTPHGTYSNLNLNVFCSIEIVEMELLRNQIQAINSYDKDISEEHYVVFCMEFMKGFGGNPLENVLNIKDIVFPQFFHSLLMAIFKENSGHELSSTPTAIDLLALKGGKCIEFSICYLIVICRNAFQ